MDKDITNLVDFGDIDGESIPLTKCACGQHYDSWQFIVSIYRNDPVECINCHRKLYCSIEVKVYEVVE